MRKKARSFVLLFLLCALIVPAASCGKTEGPANDGGGAARERRGVKGGDDGKIKLKEEKKEKEEKQKESPKGKFNFNKSIQYDVRPVDVDYEVEGTCADQLDIKFLLEKDEADMPDWLYPIVTNNGDTPVKINMSYTMIDDEAKPFEKEHGGCIYALNPGHTSFMQTEINFDTTKDHHFKFVSQDVTELKWDDRLDEIKFSYEMTEDGLEYTFTNDKDYRIEVGALFLFKEKDQLVFIEWETLYTQGGAAAAGESVGSLIPIRKIPPHDSIEVILEAYDKEE